MLPAPVAEERDAGAHLDHAPALEATAVLDRSAAKPEHRGRWAAPVRKGCAEGLKPEAPERAQPRQAAVLPLVPEARQEPDSMPAVSELPAADAIRHHRSAGGAAGKYAREEAQPPIPKHRHLPVDAKERCRGPAHPLADAEAAVAGTVLRPGAERWEQKLPGGNWAQKALILQQLRERALLPPEAGQLPQGVCPGVFLLTCRSPLRYRPTRPFL